MTIAEIVESTLDEVDFAAPVEMTDIKDVYLRLKSKLPAGALVEGVLRGREVVFDVRHGNEIVRRVKPVVEVP